MAADRSRLVITSRIRILKWTNRAHLTICNEGISVLYLRMFSGTRTRMKTRSRESTSICSSWLSSVMCNAGIASSSLDTGPEDDWWCDVRFMFGGTRIFRKIGYVDLEELEDCMSSVPEDRSGGGAGSGSAGVLFRLW